MRWAQWQRQMYYALYVRGVDAEYRDGGDGLAIAVLGMVHGLNIGMLYFLEAWMVDPQSVLKRGLAVTALVAICVPLVHVFTLSGETLRAEFETEEGFVSGAYSLGRFAAYLSLSLAFAFCVLAWAASVGAKTAHAG